jgi:hypothetical protein
VTVAHETLALAGGGEARYGERELYQRRRYNGEGMRTTDAWACTKKMLFYYSHFWLYIIMSLYGLFGSIFFLTSFSKNLAVQRIWLYREFEYH